MNYLDNLKRKATEFAESAQTFISTKTELYKISQQLQFAKEQLEMLFAELGRLTYHGNDALAGVRPETEIRADITGMLDTIAVLEECHAELSKQLAKPAEEPVQPESPVEKTPATCFCPKCGTQLHKE